ncbi:MAG: choice-of-anchor J domain-containing protein [Clostridia bacterium]|nr:choice-of-anchor J domain-containing protein [Clostridia bacterium]
MNLKTGVAVTLASLLVGCGSSNNQTETEVKETEVTLVDGYIISLPSPATTSDGYLTSIVGEKGKIKFSTMIASDAIISVPSNAIIDVNNNHLLDESDRAVGFEMTAPGDSKYVTPLTTLAMKNGDAELLESAKYFDPVEEINMVISDNSVKKNRAMALITLNEVVKTVFKANALAFLKDLDTAYIAGNAGETEIRFDATTIEVPTDLQSVVDLKIEAVDAFFEALKVVKENDLALDLNTIYTEVFDGDRNIIDFIPNGEDIPEAVLDTARVADEKIEAYREAIETHHTKAEISTINFAQVDVPTDTTDANSLMTSSQVTVNGVTDALNFNTLLTTGERDNGEIFGAIKDKNDQLIIFNDGSPYICNGTNDGVGSGLDHISILQKDEKIYMITQFECQIGAMYKTELEQESATGMLSVKPNSLEYISQKNEFGGFVHCAGITTPWESHLGSEEYEIDARAVEENLKNDGTTGDAYYDEVARYWNGNASLMSPYYYGWTPEVTIENGAANYTKHYALGRLSHELAYVMPDNKTVYMSDDGTNVGLFMFIADTPEDLSSGRLYSAKFTQLASTNGGSFDLEWIELAHATDSEIKDILDPDSNTDTNDAPKFSDIFETMSTNLDGTCPTGFNAVNTSWGFECLQVKPGMEKAAAFLETRRYAAIKGATTELRKEEGITYDPVHHKLYIAISEIAKGMEDDAAGKYDIGGSNHMKLLQNSCGGLYALDLEDNAMLGSAYSAKNFYAVLVGEPKSYTGEYAGNSCNVDKISNPDNITYIANTNSLIIGEDTSAHHNNMVWSYNVETQKLTRIATLPVGAEATSPYWYKNINGLSYATLVTQHPSQSKESFAGVFGPVKGLSNTLTLAKDKSECVAKHFSWNETLNQCFRTTTMPTYPDPEELPETPCYAVEEGVVLNTTFECGSLSPWQQYSEASDGDWEISSYGGQIFAYISGYQNDEPSKDWLISPKFSLSGDETLSFISAKGYSGSDIVVKISTDYLGEGDPSYATWDDLNATIADLNEGNWVWKSSGDIDLSNYKSSSAYIAIYHEAAGVNSGEVANWEIDDIIIKGSGTTEIPYKVEFSFDSENILATMENRFDVTITGGIAPYRYSWDFGDGYTSTEKSPTYTYDSEGNYIVKLTITDGTDTSISYEMNVTVEAPLDEKVPTQTSDVRIATFNAYLNRASHGGLTADLTSGTDLQIKNVAEIIQRVRPEIILINEFDYNGTTNVELLREKYLTVSQNGQAPIDYPYYFVSPVNTGVQTGLDLNGDGKITGDDAYGFGEFPGQYGMVVLSKYPIDTNHTRTFQKFLWKDMPDANLPRDGSQSYYSDEILKIYRLSSKSHWDIPVNVNGKTVHILASHPTPPTFDDGDKDTDSNAIDWNGVRNHDEIRFWKDYINGESYIYDDNNVSGGLARGERFVIMGDQNADPDEGDSYQNAIMQLLANELIDTSFTPQSNGAISEGVSNRESDDTANWSMRADYVLPSVTGFTPIDSGIFWPELTDVKHYLMEKNSAGENSSDHRLVWVDLNTTEVKKITEPLKPATQLSNDFKDSLQGWNAVSLASNKDWTSDSNYGAKISGYKGDEDSDDWLISPKINFTANQYLTFETATNYTGPALKVYISTDYNGSVEKATWHELNATLSSGSWAWTESGDIDLSEYNTTGFIAFYYTTDATGSATWEITNLYLGQRPIASLSDDFKSSLGDWQAISLASNKDWTSDSTYGAKISGYKGDEDSNDWLISPALVLDGNETFHFETATNYTGPKLKVYISNNFDGINVENATWHELNATLSSGSWAWEESGDIDLDAYSGIANIAFQYTSDTTGAATWEITELYIGDTNITENSESNSSTENNESEEIDASLDLVISEIADPNNNPSARFIELYNPTGNAIDLSEYALQRWTNGNVEPSTSNNIALIGTLNPYTYYTVAANASEFTSVYGVAPDLVGGTGGPADSNGDDQIAIIKTDGTVVDIFGIPGEDGSGTAHEFEDGSAVRKATVLTPKTSWDENDWIINNDSGIGSALDAPDSFTPGVGEESSNESNESNSSSENSESNETTYSTVVYSTDFSSSLEGWQAVSLASDANWSQATYSGVTHAKMNNYGSNEAADDWLISPDINLTGIELLSFDSAMGYSGSTLTVYISNDYNGSNVERATWHELNANLASDWTWTDSGDMNLSAYAGSANIAFHYTSAGTGSGEASTWEVTKIRVKKKLTQSDLEAYYASAGGLTGDALKNELYHITKANHIQVSYSEAYVLLETLDKGSNNHSNVTLIYTNRSQDAKTTKCNTDSSNDCWNREHLWPRSLGVGDSDTFKSFSDLFNLRASDASVNSDRSNKRFGSAANGTEHSEATGNFYNSTLWEPRDKMKGDIARSMFYMATRYEGDDSESDLEFNTIGDICTFLTWHLDDPVSQEEVERNNKTFEYQNNRNPFIDHPEWAVNIWNSHCQ